MQQTNPPKLMIFFGLIASGKSSLAKAWAERHGASYYNSDVIRKELAGVMPEKRSNAEFEQGLYTKELSEKTYETMLAKAEKDILAGKTVALDATYNTRRYRNNLVKLGEKLGIKPFFVLCSCSEEETKRRLELRKNDPQAVSDGTWDVYLKIRERFEMPDELSVDQVIKLSTYGEIDTLLHNLDEIIKKMD